MDLTGLLAGHESAAIAMTCGETSVTYGELAKRVARSAAAWLAADGMTSDRGDGAVAAVLGGTSIRFLELVLGALEAGLAVLPLDPRLPVAELTRAVEIAQPALVVAVDVDELGIELAEACARPVVADRNLPDVDLLEVDLPGARARHERPADAPALLLFTSGTAGSANVAALSAANIEAAIGQAVASAGSAVGDIDAILGVMPLTHVLGLVSVVGVSVAIGARLVLVAEPSPRAVVDAIEQHGVKAVVAPPVFWYRLAEADVEPSRLAGVTLALSGAAPLDGRLARRLEEAYGLALRQGYGLTEASPGLTSSVGTDAPATSVGRPMPGVELRIVDRFGDDALVGDVGEVWARGPNIFVGYVGDVAATRAVVDDDGWLHTGDLAVVDEQGYLYIVGRSKDQLIVSGFNVHPAEVEDHLVTHPQVAAAAVVGEPDREYGEIVVAWVVGSGPVRPDVADLDEHCRTRLAAYKIPRRYEFVDELPRGLTGKLRRRMLRPDR